MCMYIYIYMYLCVYVCIYIYIYRERERYTHLHNIASDIKYYSMAQRPGPGPLAVAPCSQSELTNGNS